MAGGATPGPRRSRVGGWAIAAVLAVLAVLLYQIRIALLPFIFAVAVAFVLDPLIKRLQRRFGIPRWAVAAALYVLVLAALGAVGYADRRHRGAQRGASGGERPGYPAALLRRADRRQRRHPVRARLHARQAGAGARRGVEGGGRARRRWGSGRIGGLGDLRRVPDPRPDALFHDLGAAPRRRNDLAAAARAPWLGRGSAAQDRAHSATLSWSGWRSSSRIPPPSPGSALARCSICPTLCCWRSPSGCSSSYR